MLQLHVKSVMAPMADKHLLTADLPTEFVVGPGATFKERAQKSSTNRGKVRLVKPPKKSVSSDPEMGGGVHAERKGNPSAGDSGPGDGPVHDDAPTDGDAPTGGLVPPVLGKQQMEVVSELLEKGTMLRDKMVNSVAAGTGHYMR